MRRANKGASWPHLVGRGEHDFDAAVLRTALGCVVCGRVAAQTARIDANVVRQRVSDAAQVISNSGRTGERYGLVRTAGANVICAAEDENAFSLVDGRQEGRKLRLVGRRQGSAVARKSECKYRRFAARAEVHGGLRSLRYRRLQGNLLL